MHPDKADRAALRQLTDLPNVGPAMARDLALLGISHPGELAGRDPLRLYQDICRLTGTRHDPCVLDVFMSIAAFMEGEKARPWWAFTGERKRRYGNL